MTKLMEVDRLRSVELFHSIAVQLMILPKQTKWRQATIRAKGITPKELKAKGINKIQVKTLNFTFKRE